MGVALKLEYSLMEGTGKDRSKFTSLTNLEGEQEVLILVPKDEADTSSDVI